MVSRDADNWGARTEPATDLLVASRAEDGAWGVAIAMVWFGYKNALLDMGSFRMPSLIPLTCYTASVPLSGLLIALFAVEQLVNGWNNGFEGPEDTADFAVEAVE